MIPDNPLARLYGEAARLTKKWGADGWLMGETHSAQDAVTVYFEREAT